MSDTGRAGIRLETRPLWRLRASASLTRWLLYVTAGVGIAATARFAIAPPRPAPAPATPVVVADRAAEGFATLFARRYLTWDASAPADHAQSLAPFVGGAADPDAGMRVPGHGSQHVGWTEVVQARAAGAGEHVYTVAADTGGPTPLYLSVDVLRDAAGSLRLARYPALIGAPVMAPAVGLDGAAGQEVTDAGASTVVSRALRNYVAGSAQNLAADLAPGTVMATPAERLALDRVDQLRVGPDGGVLATVVARDASGVDYTLTYEVDLLRSGGRWLVDAIQSDPRT
jgi:hypothetical protein